MASVNLIPGHGFMVNTSTGTNLIPGHGFAKGTAAPPAVTIGPMITTMIGTP
jgi:hypothetical protein